MPAFHDGSFPVHDANSACWFFPEASDPVEGMGCRLKYSAVGTATERGVKFGAHSRIEILPHSDWRTVSNPTRFLDVMEIQRMRFPDHIEQLYQEFLARRGPAKCSVCQCDILPEKRRGRPRRTCTTCEVYQTALAMVPPEPRPCEWCGVDFRPQRDAARYCSDGCRRSAYTERRRSRASKECQQCGMPLMGRARKYCTSECCRGYWNARKRKGQLLALLICPECRTLFKPWRAGVMYCSSVCTKRRADRHHSARRRAGRERSSAPAPD